MGRALGMWQLYKILAIILKDTVIDIRIILEWILRQQNMRVRIGFAMFRVGTVMDACNALINGELLSI